MQDNSYYCAHPFHVANKYGRRLLLFTRLNPCDFQGSKSKATFSGDKVSPFLIFGSHSMGLLMDLGDSHYEYAFWPIWCIPVTFYFFLPQLALLDNVSIFPKVWTLMNCIYIKKYLFEFSIFIENGKCVCRYQNHGFSCMFFFSSARTGKISLTLS